ncbi:hypothetical protein [Sorangium sp. So ce388]
MRFPSAAGPTVRAFTKDRLFKGDEELIRESASPPGVQLVADAR